VRVDYIRGGSCICAFSWVLGTPLGSCPRVPFPKENALECEPPLQLKSSGGLSNGNPWCFVKYPSHYESQRRVKDWF
jgi:hypothetical protein